MLKPIPDESPVQFKIRPIKRKSVQDKKLAAKVKKIQTQLDKEQNHFEEKILKKAVLKFLKFLEKDFRGTKEDFEDLIFHLQKSLLYLERRKIQLLLKNQFLKDSLTPPPKFPPNKIKSKIKEKPRRK